MVVTKASGVILRMDHAVSSVVIFVLILDDRKTAPGHTADTQERRMTVASAEATRRPERSL
jgi:hypothetical protein